MNFTCKGTPRAILELITKSKVTAFVSNPHFSGVSPNCMVSPRLIVYETRYYACIGFNQVFHSSIKDNHKLDKVI